MIDNLEKAMAMKMLRPIVETQAWDYCVVWKLGDDPSRYIEWMDCCCGGYDPMNVKLEGNKGENGFLPLCRDTHHEHPIKTRACEALANFPSSLPLYNGIHGEVVISNKPRWLCHANTPDSVLSNELKGTRVLIPVIGGLIELYSAKHLPEDQKTLDYIMTRCSLEQEIVSTILSHSNLSFNEPLLDQSLDKWLPDLPPSLHYKNYIPMPQFALLTTYPSTYGKFEGSSSGSNPSYETSSFVSGSGHLSPNVNLKPSLVLSPTYAESFPEQQVGMFLAHGNTSNGKQNAKAVQKPGKENYKSKNLKLERNRRKNIKEGLFALRALVPKISKMDRVSILADAIEFIEELKKEVSNLQDEFKSIEEDCNEDYDPEMEGVQGGRTYSGATEYSEGSNSGEKKQIEVQVELSQISTRIFLLELVFEEKRGGFTRLVEAMNSLGLQVVAVDVTTCKGKVLNFLKVEAHKEVNPKILRELLIKLAESTITQEKGSS